MRGVPTKEIWEVSYEASSPEKGESESFLLSVALNLNIGTPTINQSSWTATWPDWKSAVTEQKDRRIWVLSDFIHIPPVLEVYLRFLLSERIKSGSSSYCVRVSNIISCIELQMTLKQYSIDIKLSDTNLIHMKLNRLTQNI